MTVQVLFPGQGIKRFAVAPNGQLMANGQQVTITEEGKEVFFAYGEVKAAVVPAREAKEYELGRQHLKALALGAKTYLNWLPQLLCLREGGDLVRCPQGGGLGNQLPPLRDGITQIVSSSLLRVAQRQGRGDLFAPFLRLGADLGPLRGTTERPFLVRRLVGIQGQLVQL